MNIFLLALVMTVCVIIGLWFFGLAVLLAIYTYDNWDKCGDFVRVIWLVLLLYLLCLAVAYVGS